jgi:peptidoglycan hydrolase CwlO-like protein
MAELELPGGIKFKGGKIFAIITALVTSVGALWGGFEFYKDYLTMKEQIQDYAAPDLSGFDKRIDLVQQQVDMLQGEISMVLEEIQLVSSVAESLKSDLKSDITQLEKDSRYTESLVNEMKNTLRDELRIFEDDIKKLEEELDLKIKKALENPLSGIK